MRRLRKYSAGFASNGALAIHSKGLPGAFIIFIPTSVPLCNHGKIHDNKHLTALKQPLRMVQMNENKRLTALKQRLRMVQMNENKHLTALKQPLRMTRDQDGGSYEIGCGNNNEAADLLVTCLWRELLVKQVDQIPEEVVYCGDDLREDFDDWILDFLVEPVHQIPEEVAYRGDDLREDLDNGVCQILEFLVESFYQIPEEVAYRGDDLREDLDNGVCNVLEFLVKPAYQILEEVAYCGDYIREGLGDEVFQIMEYLVRQANQILEEVTYGRDGFREDLDDEDLYDSLLSSKRSKLSYFKTNWYGVLCGKKVHKAKAKAKVGAPC
ncbi:hypothetical protein L1987_87108 [Smallanthus sonchifolius]|nr:hypothetical protein L1987_87108 [Smallanthus sonchifolius]